MPNGSPPITRITFPACRAHYPGGSNGCVCRLLPHPCCLPRFAGGSASASLLSGPAQASLTLRPVGLLNRPRRPLSRGFDPAGCPTEPLVSYQSNRQFSGRNLPPLVIRAFGAHCKNDVQNCRMIYGYARVSTDGQSVEAQVKHFARGRSRQGLAGDGERRKDRPRPIAPRSRPACQRRRADGDAPRPAGALDPRTPEHAGDHHRRSLDGSGARLALRRHAVASRREVRA